MNKSPFHCTLLQCTVIIRHCMHINIINLLRLVNYPKDNAIVMDSIEELKW